MTNDESMTDDGAHSRRLEMVDPAIFEHLQAKIDEDSQAREVRARPYPISLTCQILLFSPVAAANPLLACCGHMRKLLFLAFLTLFHVHH